ncbi:MAG TPA: Dyp-type peroxidase [Aliiroseovarius sp.]|nr:Dyp-type peroxidase [Aliiroseovarius sp.]
MLPAQAILPAIPDHARYLELTAIPDRDPAPVLRALAAEVDDALVIGFGAGLVAGLGAEVPGLHGFPALTGPGCVVPSTQADILCWIKGTDRGDIAARARHLTALLAPAFRVERLTDGFRHRGGLDLSGYEDGTENPTGDDAIDATFVRTGPWAGSSFASVQKWQHDLTHFETLPQDLRDHIIGRRQSDNEELEDAPDFAHVKRTAQESFTPEAFLSRRSMPWSDASGEGLMFVAFGHALAAFEAQLHRMTGAEDGIIDGLFRFSRPVTGAHYWCPPLKEGALDIGLIGL